MKRALGVCYYPEHWPSQTWAADARLMAETGIEWVRIGEFAWRRLEPAPGEMRFDWFDAAIGVLAEAGLKVVLGTPTATPPRWMLDRWPDMLPHDREGRPRRFGSRRHYCFSHEGYRGECVRIARLLGERYGRAPAVAAWQIDNEYGCHDTTRSFSPAAAAAFRTWLAARYGEVERLNDAWGGVFWSLDYDRFDQIDPPHLTVTEANPAHERDWRRFSSDQVIAFNAAQAAALRPLTDAPLIHNYMGRITDFDHYAVGADLDVASWDSYPLGFLEDRLEAEAGWKRRFMRQGDPDFQAFHHDLYRAVGRGRWWVMEQQPGPVNWAPHNPAPLPGMARLWAWEAFAHGAEVVSYFRWRQAPMAQEQMHAGLVRPDGAPAPALAEAAETAAEIAAAPGAGDSPAAPVALIFDYESQWAAEALPQSRDFDYFRLVFDIYRGLRRLGQSIDILPPGADLSPYGIVFAPGLAALGEAFAGYGGLAVIGPRANAAAETMRTPVPLPPALPGLDCTVARVETLRPDAPVPLSGGGAFRLWREVLEGGADVAERAADGAPAIMRAGRTVYLGGWPDETALARLLPPLLVEAGIAAEAMAGVLRVRETGTERFVFNYDAEPALWRGHRIEGVSFLRLPLSDDGA